MAKNRLFITGDTHGDIDITKLTTKQFPLQKQLTKDDYVIICGDFGAIWSGNELDENLLKWYKEKPWTTLFVDGNHDNFDLLETYPVTEWNGGKVQFINDSVIHLMRGQVYTIGEVTILTCGGAMSHDRGKATHTEERDIHKIWWPQEMVTGYDLIEAKENLKKVDNKVDLVITHTVPSDVRLRMGYYTNPDISEDYIEEMLKGLDYKWHFCGHYHVNEQYGKTQILYNKIVEYKKKTGEYKWVK